MAIKRTLDGVEAQVERNRPDRAAILASLERYAASAARGKSHRIGIDVGLRVS